MSKVLETGSVFQSQFWKALIDQTVDLELLPSGQVHEYTILTVDQFNVVAQHENGEVHMLNKSAIARVMPVDVPVPTLLDTVQQGLRKLTEKQVERQERRERKVSVKPYNTRAPRPIPYRSPDEESTRIPQQRDVSTINVVTKRKRTYGDQNA